MTTQVELAKKGSISEEMKSVAKQENISVEKIRDRLLDGRIIITRNLKRENVNPIGIGEGLKTKTNANIGTSAEICDLELELEKARISLKYKADTLMDLSTGGDLDEIRRKIIEEIDIPIGTVPIYQVAIEMLNKGKAIVEMDEDTIFNIIERHAKDGVDFMTLHCGVTKNITDYLKKYPRLMGMVSRGGTFIAAWILHNDAESPFYSNYDYLLEMAQEYDFSISLGDGLRPGCIFDASDWSQMTELLTISELVKRAQAKNVQVMVEGPGHLPLDHIQSNMRLEKSLCNNAPFYVLGPLVTEIAPGYDHITCAIGGTLAALYGADFLCYVTPSEHLGLPNVEDVKNGIIATRIAAHAADIVKLGERASDWDLEMATARANLDWETQLNLAIDEEKARNIFSRGRNLSETKEALVPCSMCGEFCALKILSKFLGKNKHPLKKC
ncbi:MAG: phosphomethylpyrimidine synthase ThiC [Candidatus Helarchaeota archaeon]|nr:phosphomethylpyrimidine synthase ThiC [Candidatus Helarchaeota archaeon]